MWFLLQLVRQLLFVVAERVFAFHQTKPLMFNKCKLNLELDLPWLTDLHDKCKVRISGINEDLEKEKLRFYLSAISKNRVTDLFYNHDQTRAIAAFRDPIGMILN